MSPLPPAADGKDAGGARRPPWSEFRAALEARGFRPSKSRGQNFLLDGNMARSIARDGGVGEGDFVLEVGVGCGFLSVQLAALGVRLVGVEIDDRLFEIASRFLAPWDNVELLRADVLAGKHELAPEVLALLPTSEAWHLVSNLPYGVAGPLLAVLSRLEHPPATMTALVQKEVADRICAEAGDSEWGPLAARLAPRYRRTVGRRVGANLFWPRPRVESAVVRLELREESVGDLSAYDAVVGELFQQRRKSIRSTLGSLLGDPARAATILEETGVDPAARPGTLAPEIFQKLILHPLWRGIPGR